MKLLGEVLKLSIQYLKDKSVSSPRLVAELLLSHVLGLARIDLYMRFECPLEEAELAVYRGFLKRAACFEPVEYIIGKVDFYGCFLSVSKDVLIPRPETEILVDKAAQILQKEPLANRHLADICCGSGCIGISLKKKFPELSVYLSDKSEAALNICKKNVDENGLSVAVFSGDLLEPFSGIKLDYVFCNPPYIAEGEYLGLDSSVRDYEPKMALVGGASGLVFYERLARDLPLYLAPQGKVFLEIGAGQGEMLYKIFSSPCWKKKELSCDFAGHDRFFFLEIE